MKKLTNLRDLMLEQLSDLHSAEQLQKLELPKIRQNITAAVLKDALAHHIKTTSEQISRLNASSTKLVEDLTTAHSNGMDCLPEQAWDMLNYSADPEVLDAAMITAIQHINHYEIAGYGTTAEYAHILGLDEIAEYLRQTLAEEKQMDEQLTYIAREQVNVKAKAPLA
jgi:ferritin-like metal-binding protein YciE